MADIPGLFGMPMVRGLLALRKGQTRRPAWRRVVNMPDCPKAWANGSHAADGYTYLPTRWQRVQPGDRIWVRETWAFYGMEALPSPERPIFYRADPDDAPGWMTPPDIVWRPSIHMPRYASRITLVVTQVRRQSLHAITEADAIAEGVVFDDALGAFHVPGLPHPDPEFPVLCRSTARGMFAALWDSIHGSGAWLASAETEVVATTFDTHLCNIDEMDRHDRHARPA